MKQYPVRRGAHEFKSRATQREWGGDCPPVRAVCAGSFLSIRCGGSFWLVGAVWSKRRVLGKFRSFRGVHGRGDVSLPQFMGSVVCLGIHRRGNALWDIADRRIQIRITSVLSGLLLLSFAMGMVTGLGIKKPLDYSVFSAAAAAFLLACWEPDRFTLDRLLNRART